ncbi:DNA-binding response regulator [Nitrosomonas sp. HPC101]|uniref:response regulator transcription factor n=1 Tax=Nitrosomonas sp. HPC101 TaxID=1658667 RepID=UPI00136F7A0A|nr:response regulator transcription factor [Nitrosomonas sp. HPC101]MXS85940.1 DNA-binding response regulator [Nitrosomonas sp. HPC101]
MNPSFQARILILEDNVSLIANLFAYLEPRGYLLDAAQDGLAGLTLAQRGNYHALIVDWGLPTKEGIDVIRTLRAQDYHVPILMLTARDDLDDKIAGFKAGADDYLTKPFALAELEVRIEALLARSRGRRRKLTVGNLSFDLDTQHIWRGSRQIYLSASERRLLEVLMRASPSVVSRTELEETLWGDEPPEGNILRSHMYELRRVIDIAQEEKLLHTLRCVGYRLAAQEQN